jgi:hypothetical protein
MVIMKTPTWLVAHALVRAASALLPTPGDMDRRNVETTFDAARMTARATPAS